eukprot:scaffold22912_cov74-Skeletonema_menzelii.AAC.1
MVKGLPMVPQHRFHRLLWYNDQRTTGKGGDRSRSSSRELFQDDSLGSFFDNVSRPTIDYRSHTSIIVKTPPPCCDPSPPPLHAALPPPLLLQQKRHGRSIFQERSIPIGETSSPRALSQSNYPSIVFHPTSLMRIVTIAEQSFWGWRKNEQIGTRLGQECKNNIRTKNLIEESDIVVVRFGEKYRQWNAAFDAGYAAALGKSIITLHPPSISHMLKE